MNKTELENLMNKYMPQIRKVLLKYMADKYINMKIKESNKFFVTANLPDLLMTNIEILHDFKLVTFNSSRNMCILIWIVNLAISNKVE